MATDAMGLDFGGLNAWLIWIVPFIAALIIPAVGKGSKKATGYVAVGLSLASALFAASLLPGALEAHEVHEQISCWQRRIYYTWIDGILFTDTCWYEGIHHDKGWRCYDVGRNVFDFCICWNVWIQGTRW